MKSWTKRLIESWQTDYNGLSALVLLAVGTVLFYGLFRADPFPKYFYLSDKVEHLLAFCLLFIVARSTFFRRIHFSQILIPVLALAVCSELVQGSDWLPARGFSFGDLGANMSGTFVGLALSIRLLDNRS